MATFQITDLFKLTGLAGGASNVNALAAGGLVKLQNAVNIEAEKLGAKIGAYTGGNIFTSLAKGAKGADSVATDALTTKELGFSLSGMQGLAIGAAALLGGYFILKD